MSVLEPHEAMVEALIQRGVHLDIGEEASEMMQTLARYGCEVAPSQAVDRLGVVTLLAAVCRERGLSVHPDMLDEAVAGTLTTEQLEGIRGD